MASTVKLGAQLYTLRDFIKTYEDTEETFRYLQSIGIRTVQISGIGPIPQEKVAHLVEKYNMDVCVTHISFERLGEETEKVIAEHQMIGCKHIGIGSMPELYRYSSDGVEAFLEDVHVIGSKLRDAGMQFQYHNHAFEFMRFEDNRRIMDMLIEDSDPDELHFILDTYWLQYGGVNPTEYIKKLKGRVDVCHFKDYKFTQDGPKFTEIGTGNLNLDAMYRACRDTGVEAIVIEQDTCEIDPKESMAISYRNLLGIAGRNV